MSSAIRDLLDALSRDEEKEQGMALVGDEESKDAEELPQASCFVFPAVRLQKLLAAEYRSYRDVARMIGTHYRFLLSREIYAFDTFNYVDKMWLDLAKLCVAQVPNTQPMVLETLRAHLRLRLQLKSFALEATRYHRNPREMEQKVLPVVWQSLATLPKPFAEEPLKRDLIRLCTRWIGVMSYIQVYVLGARRLVEGPTVPDAKTTAMMQDLHELTVKRTKNLPDQFRDSIHLAIRTLQLPVDAAVAYESQFPGHGECDVNMALKVTAGLNMKEIDMFSRWVPWPRAAIKPGVGLVGGQKPLESLAVAPTWLRELWQLMTFSFFFHSALVGATGLTLKGLQHTLGEGLFLDRYFLSWWELTSAVGVVKLETKERFHVPTLPLLLHMGHGQWWVRTNTDVFLCKSLASALVAWFTLVNALEDNKGASIHRACKTFLPQLTMPVVVAVPVSPPPPESPAVSMEVDSLDGLSQASLE